MCQELSEHKSIIVLHKLPNCIYASRKSTERSVENMYMPDLLAVNWYAGISFDDSK